MAIDYLCGFELGTSAIETEALSGTCSVVSTTKRSGGFALRANPAGAATGRCDLRRFDATGKKTTTAPATTLNTAVIRFYINAATLPGAGSERIVNIVSTAAAIKGHLRLNSTGTIALYNSAGTLVATTTNGIGTGAWFRVECKIGTGNPDVYGLRLYADNDTAAALDDLSGTMNCGAAAFSYCEIGKPTNVSGQTVDLYYDDIAYASDWVGPGRCIAFLPNAAGLSSFGTGSYLDVDENPNDGDTTYMATTAGSQSFWVELQSFADAGYDTNNQINGVQTCTIPRITSGAANYQVSTKSGATTDNTTAVSLATTYTLLGKGYALDPDTSAAWTRAGVNNLQVGCIEGSSSLLRVTSVLALVDFVDGTFVDPAAGVGKLGWIVPCVTSGGRG